MGGGCDNLGQQLPWAPEMRFGADAPFGDQEHELYDLADDPGELRNLAHDPAWQSELVERFGHLLELEATGVPGHPAHRPELREHPRGGHGAAIGLVHLTLGNPVRVRGR